MSIKWNQETIRGLRLRLGWSTSEFSRRFGCQPDLIEKWEAGIVIPATDDILQMDRLEFQLDSYNEVVVREPHAHMMLREHNLEQIHQDQIAKRLNN